MKYTEKDLNVNQAKLRELCDIEGIKWEEKMSKAQLKALLMLVVAPDDENADATQEENTGDGVQETAGDEIQEDETPSDDTQGDENPEDETPSDSSQENQLTGIQSKIEAPKIPQPEAPEVAAPRFPENKTQNKSSVNLAMQQEIARRQARYGVATKTNKGADAAANAFAQEKARRQARYGISADTTIDTANALQQEIARRQMRFDKH